VSRFVKTSDNQNETKWNIRDTEFLLRLIMSSKIDGADIEQASSVLSKIKDIHKQIVGTEVNG
tara:strand:- start:24344 stop:24532 length:189 start_codon:yes stop_codon:yes gene_type:complete